MGGLGLGLGLSRPLTAGGVGGGFVDIVNNGVLAPFVTFTRSSEATRTNAAGQSELVAANVPRIDYDPATGELRGLLIEEQRTNLLLNSASLSTQSVTVAAVTHTLSFTGTGTVTLSGASTAGPLVGTGATSRVTLTFTPTAGLLTLTVSGSVTLAQLEAGNYATSYIPTAVTAQTRAADVAIVSSLSAIDYNAAEGAFYVEGTNAAGEPVSSQTFVGVSNGTANEFMALRRLSMDRAEFNVRSSNVIQASIVTTGGVSPNSAAFKMASAYKANDFASAYNGALTGTDAAGAVPTVNAMQIGHLNSGSNTNWFNGHIRRLRYYPRRLSDAQLQALTA